MSLDLLVPTYWYESKLAAHIEPTPVGGGLFCARVPGVLSVYPAADDPEPLEHTVLMKLDVVDDRLVCTSCEIRMVDGGPSVNADALRRVPIARYLREAVGGGLTVHEVDPTDERKLRQFDPPKPDFAEAGMSDAVLRDVARLYHWAMVTGDAPLSLLERDYGIPRGKASRWIATARRRGYVKDVDDGR